MAPLLHHIHTAVVRRILIFMLVFNVGGPPPRGGGGLLKAIRMDIVREINCGGCDDSS